MSIKPTHALLVFILVACGTIFFILKKESSKVGSRSADVVEVPGPDYSFVDRPFSNCKVTSTELTQLTPAEKCWVEKLSGRCTQSDDCLVACLASTNARGMGGGCWHACFEVKYPISKWSDPNGADDCRKLGKVDGI